MKAPYTPMMMQYLAIKEKHPDALIMFRLGDFYEFFFDDAKTASKELQLVLTGKNAGAKDRVPMCGIPHHAVTGYVNKLVNRGYKVGIVEQLEDPALAKGLVDRDVIQIYTPGAFIEGTGGDNNFIVAIDDNGLHFIIAAADIQTGETLVMNVERELSSLRSELDQLASREILLRRDFDENMAMQLTEGKRRLISREDDDLAEIPWEPLLENVHDGFQMRTIARLLHYLEKTQKRTLGYLQKVRVAHAKAYLQIDATSQANLELLQSARNKEKYGSLFWLLDDTKTSMGTRRLKQWIMRPSADLATIVKRQDVVACLIEHYLAKDELSRHLGEIHDLERLIARIGYGNAHGRDLLQLKVSLSHLPSVSAKLAALPNDDLRTLGTSLDTLQDVFSELERAIDPDAPATIKEGGIFKRGYDQTLDELIDFSSGGRKWIAAFEAQERERTGIKNLKVGYNSVFGYYIEVSQGNLGLVKPEFGYERKQTLTTCERFITPDLKDKESQILTAEERRQALEYELFNQLRQQIAKQTESIQRVADDLAYLDVMLSLATASGKAGYVRPTFNQNHEIAIVQGRHPVIERVMKGNRYVPNDVVYETGTDILLITGPNMGGKSTYMRQLALIVILAQLGCYVPAQSARLMVFDSMYTRIGASDDLISGQSTFMVEMLEANYALRHATGQSLLLFDEIGRGTATYDGMALAQAIMEYIATHIKAKTIFSTHYHELTHLEAALPNLRNIQVLVAEEADKVTFLYRVAPGAMNKSYGINVARLAQLPDVLLKRAKTILGTLENGETRTSHDVLATPEKRDEAWIAELEALNPLEVTPLEALKFLYELKKKMK